MEQMFRGGNVHAYILALPLNYAGVNSHLAVLRRLVLPTDLTAGNDSVAIRCACFFLYSLVGFTYENGFWMNGSAIVFGLVRVVHALAQQTFLISPPFEIDRTVRVYDIKSSEIPGDACIENQNWKQLCACMRSIEMKIIERTHSKKGSMNVNFSKKGDIHCSSNHVTRPIHKTAF